MKHSRIVYDELEPANVAVPPSGPENEKQVY